MAREVIESRLNRAAATALNEPQYKSQMKKIRWINVDGPRSPGQTLDFIRKGQLEWARVIKVLGMSAK